MADFEDTVTVDTQTMLLQKAHRRMDIMREDMEARAVADRYASLCSKAQDCRN
jgi:hypothetical protein